MTSDTSDTCLTLTGRRGIREAMQTRAELSEVVNANKNIIVDCSNVTEADLTLIQLLIAAGRSVAASGFRLTVRQNEEGALYKALQRGGFLFGLPSENCGEAGDPLAWMQSSRTMSRLANGARA
jgi:anti-anti-sigma regulatory factor